MKWILVKISHAKWPLDFIFFLYSQCGDFSNTMFIHVPMCAEWIFSSVFRLTNYTYHRNETKYVNLSMYCWLSVAIVFILDRDRKMFQCARVCMTTTTAIQFRIQSKRSWRHVRTYEWLYVNYTIRSGYQMVAFCFLGRNIAMCRGFNR